MFPLKIDFPQMTNFSEVTNDDILRHENRLERLYAIRRCQKQQKQKLKLKEVINDYVLIPDENDDTLDISEYIPNTLKYIPKIQYVSYSQETQNIQYLSDSPDISDNDDIEQDISDTKDIEQDISDNNDIEQDISDTKDIEQDISDNNDIEQDISDNDDIEQDISDTKDIEQDISDTKDIEQDISDTKDIEQDIEDTGDIEQDTRPISVQQIEDAATSIQSTTLDIAEKVTCIGSEFLPYRKDVKETKQKQKQKTERKHKNISNDYISPTIYLEYLKFKEEMIDIKEAFDAERVIFEEMREALDAERVIFAEELEALDAERVIFAEESEALDAERDVFEKKTKDMVKKNKNKNKKINSLQTSFDSQLIELENLRKENRELKDIINSSVGWSDKEPVFEKKKRVKNNKKKVTKITKESKQHKGQCYKFNKKNISDGIAGQKFMTKSQKKIVIARKKRVYVDYSRNRMLGIVNQPYK